MSKRARYIMIGGFLGAGKTTTVGRLARHLSDQGLKVGLITNDQAGGLVDTKLLRGQGFGCDTDMNVVMKAGGGIIEVQGTAEGEPFSRAELDALLELAAAGIGEIIAAQKSALAAR